MFCWLGGGVRTTPGAGQICGFGKQECFVHGNGSGSHLGLATSVDLVTRGVLLAGRGLRTIPGGPG